MQTIDDQDVSPVVIVIMGITGTGKSTFVRLLTRDDAISIGHGPTSDTSIIQVARYIDQMTNRTVILIDTPGFDGSGGVTDMDVLEMISLQLRSEASPPLRLNGLIYMHRISDPRVGGTSLKNLRMLRALCGDDNLANVRIVTTNWDRVDEQEGQDRMETLKKEIFQPFLDGGARVLRHDNNLASAEQIISELTPLPPMMMQLEHELEVGKKFNETSVGAMLNEEMARMQEKHEGELVDLQKDLEEAEKMNGHAWKEELEQERRELWLKMMNVDSERKRLKRTLAQARAHLDAQSQLAKMQSGQIRTT